MSIALWLGMNGVCLLMESRVWLPFLQFPQPFLFLTLRQVLLPAATVLVLEDTGTVLGHGVAPARLQPPGKWLGAGQHGHQQQAQHLLGRFTLGILWCSRLHLVQA